MKIQKMIMVDQELIPKLSETNASALINKLLHEHFLTNETIEEKKKRIKILEIQLEAEDKIANVN